MGHTSMAFQHQFPNGQGFSHHGFPGTHGGGQQHFWSLGGIQQNNMPMSIHHHFLQMPQGPPYFTSQDDTTENQDQNHNFTQQLNRQFAGGQRGFSPNYRGDRLAAENQSANIDNSLVWTAALIYYISFNQKIADI
jgi:hypothetical protein